MADLVELDSLEILAIVDNELDPFSQSTNESIQQYGGVLDISFQHPASSDDARGSNIYQLRMDDICCSAHGFSLMVTGIKDGKKRTMLFDVGPSENSWVQNAVRLGLDVGTVDMIQLSHWHRDHSGGMLKAIEVITQARSLLKKPVSPLVVDLHPDRPTFRGIQIPNKGVVSLEADPTFEEIENAGGTTQLSNLTHTVLDRMFLISGEIPRVTEYENGFPLGVRFNSESSVWEKDEVIRDERLLMCKVKGQSTVEMCARLANAIQTRVWWSSQDAPMLVLSTRQDMQCSLLKGRIYSQLLEAFI